MNTYWILSFDLSLVFCLDKKKERQYFTALNVKMFAVHHIEQTYTIVYLHVGVPHSPRLYLESHFSVL